MTKKLAKPRANQLNQSSRNHLSAHLDAAGVSHSRRMRVIVTASKGRAPAVRIARLAIRVGDAESLSARGLSALRKSGSVTLFRWPADVIAAGYTSTSRPRHFLRMESGDFPKRLLRAYEKLKTHETGDTVVSLIEIRTFHAHLAWGHIVGRPADDVIIPLLPSVLGLKPGKQYRRAEVEQAIAATAERRSSDGLRA
jgi:hypothetical protein